MIVERATSGVFAHGLDQIGGEVAHPHPVATPAWPEGDGGVALAHAPPGPLRHRLSTARLHSSEAR